MHQGAEKSFDISADLEELAQTPVIVVSAGAKAILDIEKTLEVLETKGVPVVAYGSDVMPAFWSRQSPFKAPLRLDDPEAIAGFFKTRRALGLKKIGMRSQILFPRMRKSRQTGWRPIYPGHRPQPNMMAFPERP